MQLAFYTSSNTNQLIRFNILLSTSIPLRVSMGLIGFIQESLNCTASYDHAGLSNFVIVMGATTPVWKIWNFMYASIASRVLPKRAKAQGLGLHSQQEIEQLTLNDIRNASLILGNKKFILGDEPCEEDCGIYGLLSQAAWGTPGSVYEKALNGEMSNLKEYCIRIRERYYPDLEKLVGK